METMESTWDSMEKTLEGVQGLIYPNDRVQGIPPGSQGLQTFETSPMTKFSNTNRDSHQSSAYCPLSAALQAIAS